MQAIQEQLSQQSEEHKELQEAWTAKLEDELAALSAQHSQKLRTVESNFEDKVKSLETRCVSETCFCTV